MKVGDLGVFEEEVEKFHQTRQKYDPERQIVKDILQPWNKKHLTIADVGCGSGRLFPSIKEEHTDLAYIGIDQSEAMVQLGEKVYGADDRATFMHGDMAYSLAQLEQESVDVVLFMKSFHHLSDVAHRRAVMRYAYRGLKYGGIVIVINRNLVQERYVKYVRRSIMHSLVSFGTHHWRDLSIPWTKDTGETLMRYYHLCGRSEMRGLIKGAGFLPGMNMFTTQSGLTVNRWGSRNLISVGEKEVCVG